MEVKLQNIYAINYAIQDIKEVWYKSLFRVFESIKDILELDYFVFLEKNQVAPSYITYRYDSRKPWLLLSESFKHDKRSDFATIFEDIDIKDWGMIQKISLWWACQWYIIIGNWRIDRNVTNVIANLLASLVNATISNRYKRKD